MSARPELGCKLATDEAGADHSHLLRAGCRRPFVAEWKSATGTTQNYGIDDLLAALKEAQPELARGVARGVLHKNTAARKLSRLSKRVAAL